MQHDDPLAGLRALHLPPEIPSFWADLGAAIALGLLIAIVVAVAIRAIRKPRRSLRRSALEELEQAGRLPPEERRVAQAALLRRIVRSLEGEAAARAGGDDWAATLDRVFRTDFFSRRAGRVFADGLYARPAPQQPDDSALDQELAGLVRRIGR
jgi:hypothetical protein